MYEVNIKNSFRPDVYKSKELKLEGHEIEFVDTGE
jgi:hypothetical protein